MDKLDQEIELYSLFEGSFDYKTACQMVGVNPADPKYKELWDKWAIWEASDEMDEMLSDDDDEMEMYDEVEEIEDRCDYD